MKYSLATLCEMQVVAGAKVTSEVKTLKDYTSLILRSSSVSQHGWKEYKSHPTIE